MFVQTPEEAGRTGIREVVLEIELGSSGRVVCSLNHWTISTTSTYVCLRVCVTRMQLAMEAKGECWIPGSWRWLWGWVLRTQLMSSTRAATAPHLKTLSSAFGTAFSLFGVRLVHVSTCLNAFCLLACFFICFQSWGSNKTRTPLLSLYTWYTIIWDRASLNSHWPRLALNSKSS